jgi:hypothetical protein
LGKPKPKNQRSKRTCIWLDNTVRAKLDERAQKDGRSMAGTIDMLLRKGLGLKTQSAAPATESKADAPIFG